MEKSFILIKNGILSFARKMNQTEIITLGEIYRIRYYQKDLLYYSFSHS